jgi:hypothetical protein
MTSNYANIYQAILQRITELLPSIVYIDLDYGQLETRERPTVAFPCVIINFEEYNFQELGALSQQAEGTIVVKLVTDPHSSSSNITPEDFREAAIAILDLEQSLFQALHGWKPIPSASALIRVKSRPDNRRPGIRVQQLYFSHSFQDHSAARTTIATPKPPLRIE